MFLFWIFCLLREWYEIVLIFFVVLYILYIVVNYFNRFSDFSYGMNDNFWLEKYLVIIEIFFGKLLLFLVGKG